MKKFSRPTHTVGHPPGSLQPTPLEQTRAVTIKRVAYDESSLEEQEFDRVEDCFELPATNLTTWIDVDGVHDTAVIESLGEHFELHPLLLEDIVHAVQRSKIEQYGGKTYMVVRILEFDPTREEIESRQISIVLFANSLITFQERTTGVFDSVRERIRAGRPRMRTSGVAYLAYALLEVDDRLRARILGRFSERAAHSNAGWAPNRPSSERISSILTFAKAAERVGYAEPSEFDEYLRQGVNAFLARDYGSALEVFRALLPPLGEGEI